MALVTNKELGALGELAPAGISEALVMLLGKPKGPTMGMKVRRARREVVAAVKDREDERQDYLKESGAEKGDDGNWKTRKLPKSQGGGLVVRLEDEAGFEARWEKLLAAQVEISTTFVIEDFEGPPQVDAEAEMDLLGPLFLDPDDPLEAAARRKKNKTTKKKAGGGR